MLNLFERQKIGDSAPTMAQEDVLDEGAMQTSDALLAFRCGGRSVKSCLQQAM